MVDADMVKGRVSNVVEEVTVAWSRWAGPKGACRGA